MMRKILLCSSLMLLTACDGNFMPDVTPKESLAQKLEQNKGPDVQGVNKTLLSSAKEYESKGDFKRAGMFYKQLLDKDATNVEALQGYAESLRRAGEFDRAIATYDLVIAQSPQSAVAYEGKGLSYLAKGDSAQAGQQFQKVMQIDQNRWRTINAVGILFAMKGLYKEAMAYYEAALKLSSNSPSVLNNVALTQALAHNYDAAIQTLEMSRGQAKPETDELKKLDLNLALVYGLAGRNDDAERIATPHLSSEALYNNLGFYAYLAKNDDLAKAYLNMALSQSKTFYEKAWKNLDEVAGDTKNSVPKSSLPENLRGAQQEGDLAPAAGEQTVAAPVQQQPASGETPAAEPAAEKKKTYKKKSTKKTLPQKSLPPVEVTE